MLFTIKAASDSPAVIKELKLRSNVETAAVTLSHFFSVSADALLYPVTGSKYKPITSAIKNVCKILLIKYVHPLIVPLNIK